MKTGLFALLLVRFAFPAAAEPPLARWVPADQAVVDGRLVIEAFDDDALFDMERWLLREKPKANPCGHEARVEPAYRSCDLLSVLSYERELLTPEKVLAEASHAAVGTVSHLEPGLYRGRLATLVTVTVDRWLLFPGS